MATDDRLADLLDRMATLLEVQTEQQDHFDRVLIQQYARLEQLTVVTSQHEVLLTALTNQTGMLTRLLETVIDLLLAMHGLPMAAPPEPP